MTQFANSTQLFFANKLEDAFTAIDQLARIGLLAKGQITHVVLKTGSYIEVKELKDVPDINLGLGYSNQELTLFKMSTQDDDLCDRSLVFLAQSEAEAWQHVVRLASTCSPSYQTQMVSSYPRAPWTQEIIDTVVAWRQIEVERENERRLTQFTKAYESLKDFFQEHPDRQTESLDKLTKTVLKK